MNKTNIIQLTEAHIRTLFSGESTGHDWWHIHRVRNLAVHIGKQEHADLFILELAALLHDIADWKFHDGDEDKGPQLAREWLDTLSVDEETVSHVCQIIRDISFKGSGVATQMKTLEGKVVQDADRLDAIGAIGIARTFAYGGSRGREMYNPDIKPEIHTSFDEYKKSKGPTLNHFYEKLLLLKDLMNTATARELAERRHRYMEKFLEEFMTEWNGDFMQ